MNRYLSLLPLALLATAASAADKAPPVDSRLKAEFAASDTDKNGKLSRAEIRARVGRMDAGRTRLSPEQAQTLADRLFTLADRNRDGGITPTEMQGMFQAMAQRYDTNHDGTVSIAERKAARAAVIPKTGGR